MPLPRIYLKGIANTRALGRVVVYVSTDFRGGAQGSYTPRLREAYVSFKGFTFGRDVTTFCDLDAGPTTIDFQGPNAYNFTFATMIRYEVPFANDHLKFGLAAELPSVSGTFGETFDPIPQRVPDFPGLFPVCLGGQTRQPFPRDGRRARSLSAQCRHGEQYLLLGWGVQASTCINLARVLTIYGNGVYGEGITNYIQDLSGLGYDFTPDPQDPAKVQTMPMWGWYGAARINILPQRLFAYREVIPKRISSRSTAISRATSIVTASISSEISFITSPRVAASPPNTFTAAAKTGTA